MNGSVAAVAPTSSPVSSASPAPAGTGLLVRNDPWPSATEKSESQTLVAAPSAPPREPAVPASPSRPPSVPSTSEASHASVGFSSVVTSAGISGAKVRVGLSHAPLLSCYERALRARPSAPPLDTEVRLNIDFAGRVVSAALARDGDLPGFRGCIESAARGIRIRDVDTGDGSATIQLRFSPR